MEKTVEQRLERLEVHLEHIQSDVTEIKANTREMDQRLSGQIKEVDLRLTGKIDALDKKLTDKIEALDKKLTDKMDALENRLTGKVDNLIQGISDLKVGRAVERVWYLLMSAGLLWVMAKAFKWI